MGTTRWASGTIAGIPIVDSGNRDCRIDVVGGEALQETLIGNSVEALDLTVHTQILARNLRGIHFGVKIAQLPASVRDDVVEAIETAMGGASPFPVVLSDTGGVDNISVLVVPDYAALGGRLHERGGMAAGYIKDVQFKFITTGEYVPGP